MTSNTIGLLVIHLNIRSLPSKIDLLKVWLTYNKPHIITLSETWLNSDISDDEIKLDNYVLFRKDRGTSTNTNLCIFKFDCRTCSAKCESSDIVQTCVLEGELKRTVDKESNSFSFFLSFFFLKV